METHQVLQTEIGRPPQDEARHVKAVGDSVPPPASAVVLGSEADPPDSHAQSEPLHCDSLPDDKLAIQTLLEGMQWRESRHHAELKDSFMGPYAQPHCIHCIRT